LSVFLCSIVVTLLHLISCEKNEKMSGPLGGFFLTHTVDADLVMCPANDSTVFRRTFRQLRQIHHSVPTDSFQTLVVMTYFSPQVCLLSTLYC